MSISQPSLELALQRFAAMLHTASGESAAAAVADAAAGLSSDLAALLEQHALQRQFVHGVGPLYVAKTRNADQIIDWGEIRNKPAGIGTIDPEGLELDASQITTGTLSPNRLPLANAGEVSHTKAVRADDPRLATQTFTATTGASLAAGDFLALVDDGGVATVVPAQASVHLRGAIGFTAESKGIGESVQVYPYGENLAAVLSASAADVGKVVFLSDTPGKVSLTPPTSGVLQPIGSLSRIINLSTIGVMVRYEFRFLL